MKVFLSILLVFSSPVLADPFNIQLPFGTQYEPGSLDFAKSAIIVGYEQGGENFQLQVAPAVTNVDKFIGTNPDHDFVLGYKIGLGKGFEIEIDTTSTSGYGSVKYSIEPKDSSFKHSILLGKIYSYQQGHGGQFIQGDEEDCGFFDIGCWLSDLFSFSSTTPGSYEYNYEAEINGSMLAYLQGYQYSANVMPYWGVYHIDYDIAYSVVDNTIGGTDQNGLIETDLTFLILGARFNVGKLDSKGRQNVWLVNYMLYKDSSSHTGDLSGELRVSYMKSY